MKLNPISAALLVICCVCINLVAQARSELDPVLLLLPDSVRADDPKVMPWLDAGAEEGLHLQPMRDSEFLALGDQAQQYAGVIVPDQVHLRASAALVLALQTYVAQGGQLMLVFDAGVLDEAGFFAIPRSRFSEFVGVEYALYDELRESVVGIGSVSGQQSWMRRIQVPPGKSMPVESIAPDAVPRPGSMRRFLRATPADPGGLKDWDHGRYHRAPHEARSRERHRAPARWKRSWAGETHQIVGYFYGALDYPSFVTRGTFPGTTMLTSADGGLAAGLREYGSGQVLFVNLPLGYLKGQTDGMLLHGFLRYFAVDLLQLPTLVAQPEGVPGMIINWHIDDGEAIGFLDVLADLQGRNVWDEGPFSIHLTAGPDRDAFGDGLGMDLVNNEQAKAWVRRWKRQRHQIGSHGGWIHDYFGQNASPSNQAQFEPLLDLNLQAIGSVLQRPVAEYSAPEGNTPPWSIQWMQRNAFLAYYFTGHTGMGPTRAYRDGMRVSDRLWAMPTSTYQNVATFEEFAQEGIDEQEAAQWLEALADFSARQRTVRMVYFHPPGAAQYPSALSSLLGRARHLQERGTFRWYTMARLARFLNARQDVQWTVRQDRPGVARFIAQHPVSLRSQGWRLPKPRYHRPRLMHGEGTVSDDGSYWLVTASHGDYLEFWARVVSDGDREGGRRHNR